MKVLRIIKKIILGILCTVFFFFAISMAMLLINYNKYGVTVIDNKALVLIKEEISSDKYKKGDLVIVESKKIEQISPGDEVFIYKVAKDRSVSIDVGIVDTINEDDTISYKNGSNYASEYVVGSAIEIYHDIGLYLGLIESKWGFLFIILVPSFFIFLYQIYKLIIEIKYGDDDELVEEPVQKKKKTKKSKKQNQTTEQNEILKEENNELLKEIETKTEKDEKPTEKAEQKD